jgi:hypothetical protein
MFSLRDLILLSFWKPYSIKKELALALMRLFMIGIVLDFGSIMLDLNSFISYLFTFLGTLVYVLIAITCHRMIILGVDSVPKYGFKKWTPRENWFAVCIFVLYFMVPLIFFKVFTTLVVTSLTYFFEHSIVYFLPLLVFVPYIVVLIRLSPIFPHIALGNMNIGIFKWSWNISKGKTGRLFILLIFMPFIIFSPFYLLGAFYSNIEEGSLAYLAVSLFWVCLNYLLTIFVISTLSVSYHWLMEINKREYINYRV